MRPLAVALGGIALCGLLSAADRPAVGDATNRPGLVGYNNPPEIVDFYANPGPAQTYSFVGRVIDENPAGLIVHFGGVIEGDMTTVQSDGRFSYLKIMKPGTTGIVTAQTTDQQGLESNVAADFVFWY